MLGAMLLNPDAIGAAVEILREEPEQVFYVEAHRHIYEAVLALFRASAPVDPVTLLEQLRRQDKLEQVGGASYISELASAVPTSANIEHYAQVVLETSLLRRLISACSTVAGEAYQPDAEVDALLDRAEQEVFSLAQHHQLHPISAVRDLVAAGVKRIEQQMASGTGLTGVSTGLHKLDEILSGLQKSDMLVLAARPSVGKTALSLNIASHIATKLKKGALIFSLEMSKEQLVQRLLCMEGRVDSQRLREGWLAQQEFPKVQRAAGVLADSPLYIDDTPNISVLEMRSKARRHATQHELSLIVVDYLQLMSSPHRLENRQVEISEISRSIKGLARELRVPVLALSQLSREADKDDQGTPKLSHLRESGAIEQDADVVMMLSRPPAQEREGRENLVWLTVAKQRNGPTGRVEVLFEQNIQLFRNLLEHDVSEPPATGSAPAAPPFEDDFSGDFDDDGDII